MSKQLGTARILIEAAADAMRDEAKILNDRASQFDEVSRQILEGIVTDDIEKAGRLASATLINILKRHPSDVVISALIDLH